MIITEFLLAAALVITVADTPATAAEDVMPPVTDGGMSIDSDGKMTISLGKLMGGKCPGGLSMLGDGPESSALLYSPGKGQMVVMGNGDGPYSILLQDDMPKRLLVERDGADLLVRKDGCDAIRITNGHQGKFDWIYWQGGGTPLPRWSLQGTLKNKQVVDLLKDSPNGQ